MTLIINLLLQSTVAAAQQHTQQSLTPVRFYAWAGSAEVNAYIQWAKGELAEHHDIDLQHVKVADISEAVSLLLASSEANTDAIDLLWINGENFAALKKAKKLLGDLTSKVPNARLIRDDLGWQVDFGTPVDGYELPWGIAQLQLIIRNTYLAQEQRVVTPEELLKLAKANPGRFTYPKPPSFHGTSWLKALAYQLAEQPEVLSKPASQATSEHTLAPLWRYLKALHPHLWQAGEEFPVSAGRQRQLYNQGVLDNSITFNPNEVKALQLQTKLASDAVAVSLGKQALTNFHYLAIPITSQRQPAALRVLNFMLEPYAQAKKGEPEGWADPSVLSTTAFSTSSPTLLMASHPEPHVSWNKILEDEWLSRYQR